MKGLKLAEITRTCLSHIELGGSFDDEVGSILINKIRTYLLAGSLGEMVFSKGITETFLKDYFNKALSKTDELALEMPVRDGFAPAWILVDPILSDLLPLIKNKEETETPEEYQARLVLSFTAYLNLYILCKHFPIRKLQIEDKGGYTTGFIKSRFPESKLGCVTTVILVCFILFWFGAAIWG